MNQPRPTIVLTGGGSGGHITPLLSLARELKIKSPNCQIIYVGFKGDSVDTFQETGHDFDFMAFIKAGKLRRYNGHIFGGLLYPKTFALNLRDLFRFPNSVLAARKLIKQFKPDVVFSKGGFVAVPIALAAKSKGVPIIAHDSDSVPGLANRIIGRWAKIHATGMSADLYPYKKSQTIQVGIPIDPKVQKVTPKIQASLKKALGFPPTANILLISGGGNGSKRLNGLMDQVAPELLSTNLSLYIVQLAGLKHQDEVKAAYKRLPKAEQSRVKVMGYSNDFQSYMMAADLVVTRAGATTLAELAAAGKACIVIPAEFLSGGHQQKNSDYLAQKDAAVVLSDNVETDEFLATINSLLTNDKRRFELARNLYATAITDASSRLAELILKTAIKPK